MEQKNSETVQSQNNFARFKAGDTVALFSLFEQERQGLYDYLLRMTGQVSRSFEALDEVERALIPQAQQFSNWGDFRVSYYATARSFCADIWNADTSRFISISGQVDEPFRGTQLPEVERQLMALVGNKREVLLLKLRGGFTDKQMARIMGLNEQLVQKNYLDVLEEFKTLSISVSEIETLVTQLTAHSIPENSAHSTSTALSALMEDVIKARKTIAFADKKILLVVVLVILLLVLLFFL